MVRKHKKTAAQLQEEYEKRLSDYASNSKSCEHCGKSIPYSQRKNTFCSHSCRGFARPKPKSTKICQGCGVEYPCPPKQKNRKYCSLQCQRNLDFNERYVRFLQDDPTAFTLNRSAKRALIRRDGDKCSICGIDSWNSKPLVFEVEHKDGNSENHVASNLCLICPNCHSQTPTYKGANKGNGRHARRQRYADGKSY